MTALVRLLVAIGVLALTTCVAGPAHAHASLVDSSPRQGEVLDRLPTTVSFEFSDQVLEPAYVVVTGPDGESLTRGEVSVEGNVVTQELGEGADGSYAMAYRVVSEDGHPISGEITFSVGDEPAGTAATADEPPATTSEATSDQVDAGAPDGSDGPGLDVSVAVALFAGAGLLLVLSRRAAP